MADYALSAAKHLVGAPAAAIFAAAEQLRGLGADVMGAPTQLRQGIASRAVALLNQQAQAQLQTTPVRCHGDEGVALKRPEDVETSATSVTPRCSPTGGRQIKDR